MSPWLEPQSLTLESRLGLFLLVHSVAPRQCFLLHYWRDGGHWAPSSHFLPLLSWAQATLMCELLPREPISDAVIVFPLDTLIWILPPYQIDSLVQVQFLRAQVTGEKYSHWLVNEECGSMLGWWEKLPAALSSVPLPYTPRAPAPLEVTDLPLSSPRKMRKGKVSNNIKSNNKITPPQLYFLWSIGQFTNKKK